VKQPDSDHGASLRPELPPLPPRLRHLPLDGRGYPVPYFVTWVNGSPDHRIADARKILDAIRFRWCWICGQRLGRHVTYAIGPMCAINRISSESPAHAECAEYSARACPFLTRPHAHRREAGKPEGVTDPAGVMIRRNPGVVLLWSTREPLRPVKAPNGLLFQIGEPEALQIYAEGRPATQEEVAAAFESGVALLLASATEEGPDALRSLTANVVQARHLLRLPEPVLGQSRYADA
jgi:hypothetical protein